MKNAKEIIRDWGEDERESAQAIIDQYGEPDEATSKLLIWRNKGRWVEIVAYKDGTQHDFPFPHLDSVESVTAYRVPTDKLSEIEAFDGSVTVKRTQGLISARCQDEQANLLAINLSHDIIHSKKTIEEAKKAYVDTMVDYRAKRPTPYMDALQFPEQKNTADADESLITPEELKKEPQRNALKPESSMNKEQFEKKNYQMPPTEGFTVTHFLTVANIERSARFYEEVFGGRVLSRGDSKGAPGYIQIANTWLIINVGGGPTPDKPSVTLSVPASPDSVSSFMNIRVANIQACYELWRSRGAEFITEPKDKYGETRCYIRDPDGYLIEVGQSKPDFVYG